MGNERDIKALESSNAGMQSQKEEAEKEKRSIEKKLHAEEIEHRKVKMEKGSLQDAYAKMEEQNRKQVQEDANKYSKCEREKHKFEKDIEDLKLLCRKSNKRQLTTAASILGILAVVIA